MMGDQLPLTGSLLPGFVEIAVLSLMGVDMSAGDKCMGSGGLQLLSGAMASLMRCK